MDFERGLASKYHVLCIIIIISLLIVTAYSYDYFLLQGLCYEFQACKVS